MNDAQEQDRLAARGLDVTVPNVARIYDYILGGKDNFDADRAAAAQILAVIPGGSGPARMNRAFLGRVVHFLAAERGIRQFLDIGSGLPTDSNVQEIAQAADPDARVVYVDSDPVVVLHAQAILEDRAKGVAAVRGDLRDPAGIIGSPAVRELIDFGQPVAVLLFAVLHFVRTPRIRARCWPGSGTYRPAAPWRCRTSPTRTSMRKPPGRGGRSTRLRRPRSCPAPGRRSRASSTALTCCRPAWSASATGPCQTPAAPRCTSTAGSP